MSFQTYKNICLITKYNKTTISFLVNYNKVNAFEYYPTFSYEVDGKRYVNQTTSPIFFKVYRIKDEKEIKLLYMEKNPNFITIKNQVIFDTIGSISGVLIAIIISILYIINKFRIKKLD